MGEKTYSEKLKDGRWQEVRLRIMERDNFACRSCKSKEMLNVHHLYYKYGLMPWEYPKDSLVTLCDNCHKKIHNELSELAGKLAFEMLTGKKEFPKYKGVNLTKLLNNNKITPTDLTNEWVSISNKINSVHANDKMILDCSMLELKSQSEIIIYHDNYYQLQFIKKFLVEIITHFRTVFSNSDIIVTLKNMSEI